MSFVTDWNVSYNNIAMVYINITTECGWNYCCTLALRNMSINFGTEFIFAHSTQYTHCSKTYHVMTSYINTHSAKALLGQ